MRRFQRATVVIVIVAGLFAVASSGRAVDEKPAMPPEVRRLLKERVAVYRQVYEVTHSLRDHGAAGFDQLLEAQSLFFQAELDACESKAERVAVLEKLVKTAEQSTSVVEALKQTAGATDIDLLKAKGKELEARIQLEKEKGEK